MFRYFEGFYVCVYRTVRVWITPGNTFAELENPVIYMNFPGKREIVIRYPFTGKLKEPFL